jgi:hypothetical protein
MKTKEEILDEKTEDWNLTMSSASRVIALEAIVLYVILMKENTQYRIQGHKKLVNLYFGLKIKNQLI